MQPMRFLGKFILNMLKDLKDKEIREFVKQKLTDMLKKTEKSLLNGIMKMWIYNNATLPKMTWKLTIYNFPYIYVHREFGSNLHQILEKWAGKQMYHQECSIQKQEEIRASP